MPDLKGNIQIIDMGAAGGFDEGIIAGNGKVGFRTHADAEFTACHGVTLGFDASVGADAAADLKLLWLLKGVAQGSASAAIALKASVIADLNIFNVLGLDAKISASAEACAAGKISVALTSDAIAEFGRNAIKEDFLYDIFIAFLNETSIGVGLWGKASAGIGGNAFLSVKGSMMDKENSGFEIDFGADFAIAVGCGYGMFGGINFENPNRFFLYSTERIGQEIVNKLRIHLDDSLHPYLEMVQYTFPTVMTMAYELAQRQIKKPLTPEEITKLILDVSLSQLQRFLLDKIVEGGVKYLSDAIEHQIEDFIRNNRLPVDKDKARDIIRELILILKTDGITQDNLNDIINRTIELFAATGFVTADQKTAISIMWLAFNSVDAIRNGVETASGSAGISNSFGIAEKIGGDVFVRLQAAPQMVKEEISRVTGLSISKIETDLSTTLAIDYILKTNVVADLIGQLPQLKQLLSLMQIHLQLTPGEIVEAAFKIDWEDNAALTNNLYAGLSGLLKDLVNNYIESTLMLELRKSASDNEDLIKYIDDSVSPSIKIVTAFVFDKVDQYLIDRDDSFFDDSFFNALTKIVSKIFTSNVIVVTEILVNHTINTMHTSMLAMADAMEREQDHVLVKTSVTLFDKLLPSWLDKTSDEVTFACKELVKSMCLATADVSGPLIYTHDRKEKLSSLYKAMFASLNPKAASTVATDWNTFFNGVTECTYIPNPIAGKDLFMLQLEIMNASMEVMLPQVVDALAIFNLRLTKSTVDLIEREVRELFNNIRQMIANMERTLKQVRKDLDKAIRIYENALNSSAALFEAYAEKIKNDRNAREKFFTDLGALSPSGTLENGSKILIGGALDSLLTALVIGAQITRTTADIPQYILGLADQFFSVIIAGLPPEFTLDALENGILNYLDAFKDQLGVAIASKQAEIDAERIKNNKETEEEIRKAEIERIKKNNQLPNLELIKIEFISPVPFITNGKTLDWTYGKELPLQINLINAKTIHLTTQPQSIFIAINGHDYDYDFSDWSVARNGKNLSFETVLSTQFHPLVQGINVIECTVIQHDDTLTRATIEFMMNPQLASECTVVFDLEKSIINAGGNDHENTKKESVAFTNIGNMPADMNAWILSDRKNHLYIFPEFKLMPHETVRVITGIGINTKRSLYQNKTRAIWNNRGGDTVFLINKDRVLVLNQKYKI